MSFGFSPGDIVLFTKFAWKIVSSLKENGSTSDFQQAKEQCEAFLSLIEETQHLDLSIVPESFRQKIFENSTNMQRLVETFKKSIEQYEKSMGKDSSRGSMRSAPRKVKWALLAAEDLKTFRNGLGSYVQLAQLTIQTSMLAIIGSRSQLPPMTVSPSHNLLRNDGSFYSTSEVRYSPIVPPFIGGYEHFRQVDDLTNIVYKRLLTRPAIQLAGRVNTLPDNPNDIISSTPFDSMQRDNLPSSTSHSRERQLATGEEPLEIQGTSAKHSAQQSLADEIDEYLTSMKLDKLSREERVYVEQNDQLHPHPPLSGAMQQRTRPQILGLSNVIDSLQPYQDQTSGSNEPYSRYDTKAKASKSPRLDPLSAAASIIGFYASAAEFSLKLSNIFRDMNGECKEVRLLSQRLGQYSELLQSACGVVTAMSFSEELRGAGTSILHDNECLTKDVEVLLSRYAEIYKYRLIRKLTWNLVKRDILNMVEQIDFLKSSLSLMLQLYQVKMTESQIQMSRQSHWSANLA
ncbi:uncharacterized protein N7446_005540 [Penicillium canescens]|uniref:Uncharacterized protein n=1 Tax=Penicillium canescens TaxID=5083 RepID=A0AAD6II29_PENCN|nr:uncharacterized protein N7446_005540 [Penicillium canescens]KAJ6050220.1 hypothetical protein N7444_006936 [Penicillium canescens]KAJ6050916.1 hypothetical protein N7460_001450 [Penicillium canescens]KAJ6061420.1 hypothetical protein N7446_005540 [Penicillium canescens]